MITPHEEQPALAKELGIKKLYFKREDLHPYKSHKGRSIPLMMKRHIAEGKRRFGISSSGNAALAAALFVNEYNRAATEKISLEIFVGQHISKEKLALIEDEKTSEIALTQTERPVQALFARAKDGEVVSLRQSHDDLALEGYAELANELSTIEDLSAVFVPTSSGTTAQALAEEFAKMGSRAAVHIVQTISCHPMTDTFTTVMQTEEQSIADAIVDHIAFRKTKVEKAIDGSAGTGWVITNDEIRAAIDLAKKHSGIELSPNSALGLAALMQASYTGEHFDGSVCCVVTGR